MSDDFIPPMDLANVDYAKIEERLLAHMSRVFKNPGNSDSSPTGRIVRGTPPFKEFPHTED